MPYCTIEEAWTPVSYGNATLYGADQQPLFQNQCDDEPKPPKKRNFSRTNQRLPSHSGPINRVPGNKQDVLKFRPNSNERYIAKAEESYNNPKFNYSNEETPYTAYDNEYLAKSEDDQETPVYEVKMRNRKKKKGDMDSIQRIIEEVENNTEHLDDSKDDNTTVDTNSIYKEMDTDDKNDIIKSLIRQNQKLKDMLKNNKPNGVFNVWDFVIVLLLGIIMVIVLDYVYKIAIQRFQG